MKSKTKRTHYSFIVFLAIGSIAGCMLGMKPWHYYWELKDSAQKANAKAIEAERKTQADEELDAHYNSSIGKEELARQNGWHLPGEIPVSPHN